MLHNYSCHSTSVGIVRFNTTIPFPFQCVKYGGREQTFCHKYPLYKSHQRAASSQEGYGGSCQWGANASHKLFGCAIIFALWNRPPVEHLDCRSIYTIIRRLMRRKERKNDLKDLTKRCPCAHQTLNQLTIRWLALEYLISLH